MAHAPMQVTIHPNSTHRKLLQSFHSMMMMRMTLTDKDGVDIDCFRPVTGRQKRALIIVLNTTTNNMYTLSTHTYTVQCIPIFTKIQTDVL